MNILVVCEIDYIRKVVFEIHALSELLSLRGHNVYVIDYESMWERDGRMISPQERVIVSRVYPKAQVTLIRPSFVKLPIVSRLSAAMSSSKLLRDVLDGYDIDIVILYSVPTNGVQTIREAIRVGVPVIFRSIDTLHKLVPKPLSPLTKLLEVVVYRTVDRVLTITPALSRYVVKLGADVGRVGILPLGVDTESMGNKPDGESSVILFAGTLPHFSGLDSFLHSFVGMMERLPNINLLIVGDGPQRKKLERIIKEHGMEGRVTFTGLVPHSEVPHYIWQADVCLNTFPVSGATRDILPTKVLQYMAGGKPVVSTPLRGMLDMGIGGDQGVLYTKNGDWVSPLVTALLNKHRLGENARRYVVQNHSYDKVIGQLETEMEALCGSCRSR